MDPVARASGYGSRFHTWGGGVDTQNAAVRAHEQVRDEVLRRCEIFSKDGGFVFNAIHNIQAKTPVENIVAMLDAVHEFNGGK
ncbi:MAG: uroporphyrinogen decarboxylase family protein [Ruthenibacterium lactatiformans]